jgi:hypothetical protein
MNAQALEDLKGELIYKPDIVGDFPRSFPIEERLKLKRGGHVRENDLSMDKNYFNGKMGVIKSLSSQEILVHFPEEDKTIEVENTNGRIFDIKSILQQRRRRF